ncbi:His Kinase A (phospho-acceptor) domain-containing protein [Aquiflexum balticum DSM 16537]|uniref:histidine kinase n=2 Tax=Aquiflexum TaxID=280472 RepID=A0A1W2H1Q3_9BACT|nr:His Kinase A (phospho-acceptor) domain-containing protein [Aquiflexum balticum DSM 16537]
MDKISEVSVADSRSLKLVNCQMMPIRIVLVFALSFIFISEKSFSQTPRADSLLTVINSSADDSLKVRAYLDLGQEFLSSDISQAIHYLDDAILIALKIDYKKGLADAYNLQGRALANQGNFQDAIFINRQSLTEYQNLNDKAGEANILSNLGSIYYRMGNSSKALEYHFQSLKISQEIDNKLRIGTSYNNIGTVYQKSESTLDDALDSYKKALDVFEQIDYEAGISTVAMNIGEIYFLEFKYDSAIQYHQVALEICDGTIDAPFPLTQLGEIYGILGEFETANNYHRRALGISEKLDAKFDLTQSLIGFAKTQKRQGDSQQAIRTLERARVLALEIDAKNELKDAYEGLSELFALAGDYRTAYENEINAKAVKEEIAKSSTDEMIRQLQFEFELSQKEAEIELLQKDTELKNAAVSNQRIVIFAAFGGLVMFLFISISLFRNNLSKKKANHLLQVQKEEIHAQREKVELALDQLKSTQAQLIHSEKMASLGELTAGIAHEIKNPLNFVNNFSEVSYDMILEIQELRSRQQALDQSSGNSRTEDDKLEDELLRDIRINLEKVTHHGQRADAIVQGMLEHSKIRHGQKEATDLNNLAKEYLNLTYQSFKAKNKDTEIKLITDFDPKLPKIEIVRQDFGRVFLNIINNAFYVLNKKPLKNLENKEDYIPTLTLSTSYYSKPQGGKSVRISISDNGPGIPDKIKDKIFQPFFTTKPTGEGTGLGLSLSYDIIKANGGEIKVISEVGKGTTFVIELPAQGDLS